VIVIPAVDIKDGVAVRLMQGKADRESLRAGSPVDAAKRWAAYGPARLHVVDLDGAFGGKPANARLVKEIIAQIDVPVEVGGGIRTADDARAYLDAGAARVVLGTRAAQDPAFLASLAREYPGRVNLGLDCSGGFVAVKGWVEASTLTPQRLLEGLGGAPLGEVIYTDISKDGMLSGPAVESTKQILADSPYPVIASGGVSSHDDLMRLRELDCFGAIVGRAIYDGKVDLERAIREVESRS